MNTLPNPHDRFVKAVWSQIDVASGFLHRYLPSAVQERLDFSTLELTRDSFIDPDLSEHLTDLLYRIQTVDNQPVQVYVLLEHKSYPDRWVPLQLLRYLTRLWEQKHRDTPTALLPPTVAIVLYHGVRRWDNPPGLRDLFQADTALQAYLPEFRYILCDLSQDDLSDLHAQASVQMALRTLKYFFSNELPQRLPDILRLSRELFAQRHDALAFLETLLRYLAQSEQLTVTTLQQALSDALPYIGEANMPSPAQIWLEQGRQEGLQQGVQQGMQQGMQQGELHALIRLLQKRFGPLPATVTTRLQQASLEQLEQWFDQALDAPSLEALFSKE